MKKLFIGWLTTLFLFIIPTLTLADNGYRITGPGDDSKSFGIGVELYMPGGAEVSCNYNITRKFGLQALIGFTEWSTQDMYGVKALYRLANLGVDHLDHDIGNLYVYSLLGLYKQTQPDEQATTVSLGFGTEITPFFLPKETLRFVGEFGLIKATDPKYFSVVPTFNFGVRYYF